MTYLILIGISIVVGLYISPNETKAGLKWSATGLRGVAKDAHALHLEAKKMAQEDPDIITNNVDKLNKTVFDTTQYHKEATKRQLEADKRYQEALARVMAQ